MSQPLDLTKLSIALEAYRAAPIREQDYFLRQLREVAGEALPHLLPIAEVVFKIADDCKTRGTIWAFKAHHEELLEAAAAARDGRP